MMNKENLYTLLICSLLLILSPCNTSASDLKLVQPKLSNIKRIAIDPGFGGRDFGASGYIKGAYSKDVNLEIARKLSQKIREELHLDVIMTRKNDLFVTLEERTAIANLNQADLFLSIHTNASKDQRAGGIETYFLNLGTDDDTIFTAARENATSLKNINDLQTILSDLMQNAKLKEPERLANQVQKSLYIHMNRKYSNIRNRGTQSAPFYVLIGTQMPAILVVTSFISNPMECKRLISEEYQNDLCEGIVSGIKNYIKERKSKEK